jgi:hypothetical protein
MALATKTTTWLSQSDDEDSEDEENETFENDEEHAMLRKYERRTDDGPRSIEIEHEKKEKPVVHASLETIHHGQTQEDACAWTHGQPLHDTMVVQFIMALNRLARRAKQNITGTYSGCGGGDPTIVVTVIDIRDENDRNLQRTMGALWVAVASIDGYCGQTLSEALGT